VVRGRFLAEIAVGQGPRAVAVGPDCRIWVSNRDGASISVIDSTQMKVVATHAMPRASQPWGIVATSDGSAWVVLAAQRALVRLDRQGVVRDSIVIGANARHVSADRSGTRLFVPQFITPPQPGESTANVRTQGDSGAAAGAQIEVIHAATKSVVRTISLGFSPGPDTESRSRGVPNYVGAVAIAPDGKRAWVPSKQDNIQRGALRDGQGLTFNTAVRAISSLVDLNALAEIPSARVHHDDAGYASAAIYHPSGRFVFVALESSREIAVIDAVTQKEIQRIPAGVVPQGLAVSADGRFLLVQNFLDRTVGIYVIETHAGLKASLRHQVVTIGKENLAPAVLMGKRFFNDAGDPRLARDGYIACASCHLDGGFDGRTWDFSGVGEGLRNTQSLEGRRGGQGRLHWSGNFDEVQDFEVVIRSFAGGSGLMSDADFNQGTRSQGLGDPKAGVSPELDALAAYVKSLNTFAPSPFRNQDGSLTEQGSLGAVLFQSKGCTDCHGGPDFTLSEVLPLVDIGTIRQPTSGKRLGANLPGFDVQTLRDVWSTAPYLHDGSALTIDDAIRAHRGLIASDQEIAALARFVAEIGDGPALSDDTNAGAGQAVQRGVVRVTETGTHTLRLDGSAAAEVFLNVHLLLSQTAQTVGTSRRIMLTVGQQINVEIRLTAPLAGGQPAPRLSWQRPGRTQFEPMPVH